MHSYKRTDDNQTEMVKAARNMGATVQILSSVGKGCPDLLIGFKNKNLLVEVKDGNKYKSQRELTIREKAFHESWKGQVCIIETIDELILLLNGISYEKGN